MLDVATPDGDVRLVTDPCCSGTQGAAPARRPARRGVARRGRGPSRTCTTTTRSWVRCGCWATSRSSRPRQRALAALEGLAGVGLGAGPEHDARPLAGPVPGRPRGPRSSPRGGPGHGSWHDVGAHVRIHLTPRSTGTGPCRTDPTPPWGTWCSRAGGPSGRSVTPRPTRHGAPAGARGWAGRRGARAGGGLGTAAVRWSPGPGGAARVCAAVGVRVAIPVHWGRCTHRARRTCPAAGWTTRGRVRCCGAPVGTADPGRGAGAGDSWEE
ncbi:hypothetical protein NKG05_00650 [Oerskovia sp. M15]